MKLTKTETYIWEKLQKQKKFVARGKREENACFTLLKKLDENVEVQEELTSHGSKSENHSNSVALIEWYGGMVRRIKREKFGRDYHYRMVWETVTKMYLK